MGLLSNKVKRGSLVAGDHIYVWRTLFIYSHHGIYVGGNRVIHFTNGGDGGGSSRTVNCQECAGIDRAHGRQVICSCLDCFLAGHKLRRFEYGVSVDRALLKRGGCCSTLAAEADEKVIHRATYLLQHEGFPPYDLINNNCQDFARYCKTGCLRWEFGGMNGQMNGMFAVAGFTGEIMAAPFTRNGQGLERAREMFVETKLRGDKPENLKRVEVEELVSRKTNAGRRSEQGDIN